MYGGQSTYIPLKVNQSGVIPVIFATLAAVVPGARGHGVAEEHRQVDQRPPRRQRHDELVLHRARSRVLIMFFSYFYTAIAFNPQQQADIIRKQGGFIPGIRPGPPTERYLAKVLNRITLPGALYLTVIAIIPFIVLKAWSIQDPVRWRHDPHRGRRHARDHEADSTAS